MKKMIISALLIMTCGECFSNTCVTTLRLAVLNNPSTMARRLWLRSAFESTYTLGLVVAKEKAKEQGICLKYKTFYYGSKPLGVLTKIGAIKKWNPDFIIGPDLSSDFLLLQKYFRNTLVISPYPSDEAVYKMPNNFYTLSYSDNTVINKLVDFLKKQYPDRGIYNLVQSDCKDCVDSNNLFLQKYKKSNPTTPLNTGYYLGQPLNSLNIKKLLEKYHKGDVIVLQANDYYFAEGLIAKIAATYNQNHFIFINLLDNWGNRLSEVNVSDLALNYTVYRIIPWLFTSTNKTYTQYQSLFKALFHRSLSNSVTYMVYLSASSVLDSISDCEHKNSQAIRKKTILKCFLKKEHSHKNFFRPKRYAIYKLTTNSIKFAGAIPAVDK